MYWIFYILICPSLPPKKKSIYKYDGFIFSVSTLTSQQDCVVSTHWRSIRPNQELHLIQRKEKHTVNTNVLLTVSKTKYHGFYFTACIFNEWFRWSWNKITWRSCCGGHIWFFSITISHRNKFTWWFLFWGGQGSAGDKFGHHSLCVWSSTVYTTGFCCVYLDIVQMGIKST